MFANPADGPVSITLGILVSYWLEYGTQYIGGTRCAPDVPYTGGTAAQRTFDPRYDVGPNGCTGQSQAAWRVPFALQIAPALILGIGMLFFPESPRFFLMRKQEERALRSLAKLRRVQPDDDVLREEYLSIKAEVLFDESVARDKFPGKHGVGLFFAEYVSLVSTWPSFKRLMVGCCIMFFQQFIGCNAMIYYAPTIFGQLGLSGNATSLLATGVYGIVNTLSTLPALFLIDRIGRRPLLMAGAVGTCISLVIVGAIIGAYGATLPDHKAAAWTGIAFIYIYDVNFSYSFAPIGWVLPSEILTSVTGRKPWPSRRARRGCATSSLASSRRTCWTRSNGARTSSLRRLRSLRWSLCISSCPRQRARASRTWTWRLVTRRPMRRRCGCSILRRRLA